MSAAYGTTPVRTRPTATYSTEQMASEASVPMGTSRCGLRASCAAVDTLSAPMNAKKSTEDPRSTPDQPKTPNVSVAGGTKGDQLATLTYVAPAHTKTTSTATLSTTTTRVKNADSWMPTKLTAAAASTMAMAGTLSTPPVGTHAPAAPS